MRQSARNRPASREPRVSAAIDCGSNSVHLLVAVVDEHGVRPLADESTFLGLGSATTDGYLGSAAIERLVATLVGYARAAQGLGAERVRVVGTEPFRRASDAGAAAQQVKRAAGLRLDVIDHDEEAFLTVIGVTGGRRAASLCAQRKRHHYAHRRTEVRHHRRVLRQLQRGLDEAFVVEPKHAKTGDPHDAALSTRHTGRSADERILV